MTDMRNDQVVQAAVMNLFVGCAPERRDELDAMVRELQLQFQVHNDNHADGKFIFDAGAYRYIRFNPRSMRLFWLGAYIAWEGFCAPPMQVGQPADLSRFTALRSDRLFLHHGFPISLIQLLSMSWRMGPSESMISTGVPA